VFRKNVTDISVNAQKNEWLIYNVQHVEEDRP
jgi:hypothetical protein